MRNVIEAADLTLGYERAKPVLEAFNLTAEAYERVAIVGLSGSGKSTLLFALGLLMRPISGRLAFCGTDVADAGDAHRSRLRSSDIGFIFQDTQLDDAGTVLENVVSAVRHKVQISRKEAIRVAMEHLETMAVDHLALRSPRALSGGQAQRVGVARALAKNPKLVLADEPTGNLDAVNAAAVVERLDAAAKAGACVIIVTHDPRVASSCDRTALLSPNR